MTVSATCHDDDNLHTIAYDHDSPSPFRIIQDFILVVIVAMLGAFRYDS